MTPKPARPAEWIECSAPAGDLCILFRSQATGIAYYQSLKTGHVYRLFIAKNKWEFAR